MALLRSHLRSVGQAAGLASLLVTVACAKQAAAPQAPQVSKSVEPWDVHLEETPLPLEASTGEMKEEALPRQVGDVWVHRFSGAYRGEEIILREEVLDLRENVLTVDYQMTEGESQTHLRVQMGARSERILAVYEVKEGEEISATEAEYDAMLAKTLFVPDQNNGAMASKNETCLVGKSELNCEITEYQVRVGDKEAKLAVTRSGDVKRDVSGEVVAVDGTVLYHAELIEMQRGEAAPQAPGTGVAMVEEEVYEER